MGKDSNETPRVQETEMMDTEAPPASDVDESASTAKESTTEELDEHSELEEAKAQAAEYLDGWQRARAEFANFRRCQEQRRK